MRTDFAKSTNHVVRIAADKIDRPANPVGPARMSVCDSAATRNLAIDGTDPADCNGTIGGGMNEDRSRRKTGPYSDRLLRRIDQHCRVLAVSPGMKSGLAVHVFGPFGHQAQTTAGIQEEPYGGIAISIRLRVCRKKRLCHLIGKIP